MAKSTAKIKYVRPEEEQPKRRVGTGPPGITEYTETHPAFGTITLSRAHGTPSALFGSAQKRADTVILCISHAERHRGLNQDYVHSTKQIVEVEMSSEQFASMITSMNVGDGVACTIMSIEGQRVSRLPYTNPNTEYVSEFGARMKTLGSIMDDVLKDLEYQLTQPPRLSVLAVRSIFERMQRIRQEIAENFPFVAQQFQRHMEHVVTQSKAEVEAFVTQAVQKTGLQALQALRDSLPTSPELTDGAPPPVMPDLPHKEGPGA